jgi:hypothetical protein
MTGCPAFSERAVKKNISAPTGRGDEMLGSQPCFVETIC